MLTVKTYCIEAPFTAEIMLNKAHLLDVESPDECLKKLWLAWEPQQEGWACEGLRIYKAESPDLYPSDQARRHQMRWLRQGDGNRFDQFRAHKAISKSFRCLLGQ
ncbi:TPA: hypothetical protein ACH3X3_008838 [Trebouxia sp. C0006]